MARQSDQSKNSLLEALRVARGRIAVLEAERASADLRADETWQRFLLAINAMSEGFVMFDKHDRLVLCNAVYKDLFGHEAQQVHEGQSWHELNRLCLARGWFADETLQAFHGRSVRRRQGPSDAMEVQLADGRWLHVRDQVSPAGDIVSLSMDVTQRKRAENALRDRERLFHEMLEASPAAVAIGDAEGRWLWVNARMVKLLGQPSGDLIGRENWRFVVDAELRETLADRFSRGESLVDVEAELQRQDGDRIWALLSCQTIDYAGASARLLWAYDITRMKEAETVQRQANERLRKLSEAKSSFLANISHELRTPLNAIIGFSDLMRRPEWSNMTAEQNREYAQDIHDGGTYLLSLINDLLDLSKIEAGAFRLSFEDFDPSQSIDMVGVLLRDTMKSRRIAFRVGHDAPPILLHADQRAFRQILINLLSNAIKFAPEGSEISITTCLEASGTLGVSVADQGPGIPWQEQEAIFRSFHQVQQRGARRHEGTGLGLAISKSLMELHGGTIVLRSSPDEGSCFTLRFPAERVVVQGR